MTHDEKILVDAYLKYREAEKEAWRLANKTLNELSALAPHKVGEIVKWTECKKKNVGTWMKPVYEDMPPKDCYAVLTRVDAIIDVYADDKDKLYYRYEFKSIKKDGGISEKCVRVRAKDYEWTGDIHKDYK